jgi:tRNA modification GTPase
VEALRESLIHEVEIRAGVVGDESGIAASVRQIERFEALARALGSAEVALAEAPLEAALVDLNEALSCAGSILGDDVSEAVLDRIFSAFCLGK